MEQNALLAFAKGYSRELVCYHDPTCAFITVSDSVSRILGYDQEDLVGKNLYDFIHDDDKDFFEMMVHLPILGGEQDILHTDLRVRSPNGGYFWLNIDVVPHRNENHAVVGLVTIARDTTDFMLAKEKFEKRQALLVNTGQLAQLGAWEMDLPSRTRIWSRETYDIFEANENEKPDFETTMKCFPGEAETTIRAAIDNAIVHGVPYNLTVPFVTTKGKKMWVRAMATPKIHLGKVVKLYGVIQNIDKEVNNSLKLNSMIKQLTKQNQQLEDFTHILSHNVRGPISSLTTILDMFEHATTEAEKTELLDMLKMSSKSLEDLLNELKEVINATHVRGIESQENSLHEVLNSCLELLAGEIKQTNATINLHLDGWEVINYPKIYLESIMMNLMSNALKYKADDRNPVINIATRLENGLYLLTFGDNGSGIDMEKHRDNVFKLYKTFNATKPGKGLGLFMTKSQIEAMGGEITVESSPNVGTTFTIVFNKEKIGQ
jgi:PAS domain S-box-containing protein